MPTCHMIDREMCVLGTSQQYLQLLDVGVRTVRPQRFPEQSMKLCPVHILDHVFFYIGLCPWHSFTHSLFSLTPSLGSLHTLPMKWITHGIIKIGQIPKLNKNRPVLWNKTGPLLTEESLKFSRSLEFRYTSICKFIFSMGVTTTNHQMR